MRFHLAAYRFEFRITREILFPSGTSANAFRGGLGAAIKRIACNPSCPGVKSCSVRDSCAYSRFFEPVIDDGPSGLHDPPRPFVLRPRFDEGRPLPAGSNLLLDVHVFDVTTPFLPLLIEAMEAVARDGLGPDRGDAQLVSVRWLDANREIHDAPIVLRLPVDGSEPANRIRIEFLRPTELKQGGAILDIPEFAPLADRVRDRLATLDRLYGAGELRFDWNAMSESASRVRLKRHALVQETAERRSSRTGQVHPLGGFTGWAEYQGDLGPFIPLLRAGEWAGVGRQTVWGKGEYRVHIIDGVPQSPEATLADDSVHGP